MITIHLNGEPREVREDLDLAKLLDTLSLPSQRVAIELNGRVIRRVDWPGIEVGEGDRVEVVHFVGGG